MIAAASLSHSLPLPMSLKLVSRSHQSLQHSQTLENYRGSRLQKSSAFLYLQDVEKGNSGLIPVFVLPQPVAGKSPLAMVLRKDVKYHTGRKLQPPKGKVRQRNEDSVNFYSPHNKHKIIE